MSLLANFFNQMKKQRIEAPRKIEFHMELSSSFEKKRKREENKVSSANKNTIGSMTLAFVDNFRKMVDFSIEKIKEDDPDYEEFCNDPKIPLLNYIDKIIKYTQIEWTALPGCIVLLEKMKKKSDGGSISINNMHRLLVVALLLSDKFLEDVPARNEDFAKGSGFDIVFFLFFIFKTNNRII